MGDHLDRQLPVGTGKRRAGYVIAGALTPGARVGSRLPAPPQAGSRQHGTFNLHEVVPPCHGRVPDGHGVVVFGCPGRGAVWRDEAGVQATAWLVVGGAGEGARSGPPSSHYWARNSSALSTNGPWNWKMPPWPASG